MQKTNSLINKITIGLALGLTLSLGAGYAALAQKITAKANTTALPYKDAKLSPAERAKDLLSRMTLEEKIGQMTQVSTPEINRFSEAKNKAEKFRPYLDPLKAEKMIKEFHVGSFLAAFAVSPTDWYLFSEELQRVNLKVSRLGIPIIYGNDNVHGANYVSGAAIFPQPINIAATFNVDHAAAMGRVTARETADLGQHWNFAPILDVGRNPYWPRQYETFGEDTYTCGTLGAAYIRALQEEPSVAPYKVAACAKHFIGYSDPKSGWDRVPSSIPDQELREIFLPPFKKAVEAGVKTFMVNSGELNGIPVHANKHLLTDVLRKELGFDGVIVTDWADILQLIAPHKVAHNEKEATLMALTAGCDMSMTATTTTFCGVTKELVEEGTLPLQVVDDATFRILRLKFELGLFENPYPRKDRFDRIGSPEHRKAALEATQEGIVLLQNNDNLLPLKADAVSSWLVLGPQGNSRSNIAGGWTLQWNGAPEEIYPKDMPTVLMAIKTAYPKAEVAFYDSIPPTGSADKAGFDAAIAKASHILVAVGEKPYAEGNGNIQDLALPDVQQDLIAAAVATHKPMVLAMFAGRPRLITRYIGQKQQAFLWAGLPGLQGATAFCNLLTGAINPSGKLPFSYPRAGGHITPYNVKAHDVCTALYPFGTGMGYSTISYSNLTLTDTIMQRNKQIRVSVTVSNKGKVAAKEAVLWYLKDEVRTITPATKYLANFSKINLSAGESQTVSFTIDESALSFPDANGHITAEAGYFVVEVGGIKKRFFFKTKTGGLTQQDANRKYLQQDLY